MYNEIKSADPEVFAAMEKELDRQRYGLEMIPSENYTSEAVMEACGSIMTNKYSEGYPGRRYYGGNQFTDVVEKLAIGRCKALFGVESVNVQPYSGSPANLAVYLSVCAPGDVIMGQDLYDGGHLTHGWKTSVTGRLFKSVQYHVKPDGYLNIEEVKTLAEQNKPVLMWVGSTAYSREFPFKEFSEIADSVGAYLAADISHIGGLVAAGIHTSPVPYVHIITTTTHKTLRGPRAAMIMVTKKGLAKDPELSEKIDKTIFPGMQGGPHENTIAGIAIALKEAGTPEFKEYAKQIVKNSKALAAALMKNGFSIPTGGTDNHMMLVDLTPFGLGLGQFAQEALEFAGITINKNTVPGEKSSPFYPSGIRLGTPALTTRGMKEPEMELIGNLISDVVKEIKNLSLPQDKEERKVYISAFRQNMAQNKNIEGLHASVVELSKKFPLYPKLG
jgi:glycine hydroxymethyltransferase